MNLNGSQNGVAYQLRRGGVAVGAPVAGTGAALSFGNQTVVWQYSVTATNTVTGCMATMTGTVEVKTVALPTIFNVTGGGAYCVGGIGVAVGLSGSQLGVSGECQLRALLSNSFPRLVTRYENLITQGRTGWMKLWVADDATGGLLGLTINAHSNATTVAGAFERGHNLHVLRLTSAARLTVPVFPPGCGL